MISRRKFVMQSVLGTGALLVHPVLKAIAVSDSQLEISLAEWSLHRTIRAGKIDHLDFATIAKREYGISVVEYVNGLFGGTGMNFKDAGKNSNYLKQMLTRSKDAGVINHLLMVDEEG